MYRGQLSEAGLAPWLIRALRKLLRRDRLVFLPSFLPSTMTTTPPKPVPAEAVPEHNGLIHGLSAAELQVLCEKSLEARAAAYCECPATNTPPPLGSLESLPAR